jgi:hypothetical protein
MTSLYGTRLLFYLTDLSRDDFCERRDIAKPYLKQAFAAMQDYRKDTEWKDDESPGL